MTLCCVGRCVCDVVIGGDDLDDAVFFNCICGVVVGGDNVVLVVFVACVVFVVLNFVMLLLAVIMLYWLCLLHVLSWTLFL